MTTGGHGLVVGLRGRHPVLEHLVVVRGEVIGGRSKRGWIKLDHQKLRPAGQAEEERASLVGLVKKGTVLRLFQGQRQTKTARLDDLTFDGAQTGDSVLVPAAQDAEVALTGAWDPFPRGAQPADKKRFRPLVARLLKGKAKGKPTIEQVEQVDLDGDGADDFVVVAKGKDFWLAAVVSGRPEGERIQSVRLLVNDVSVGGQVRILDANGDGKLELLLETYVEGDSYRELYDLGADGTYREVLRTYHGC
jgi:hypothetical protein